MGLYTALRDIISVSLINVNYVKLRVDHITDVCNLYRPSTGVLDDTVTHFMLCTG